MINVNSKTASLIAIDWGTTNRCAYLLDQSGSILEKRTDQLGLANIRYNNFEEAYKKLLTGWGKLKNNIPTLMSGMVGASTGWIETPYCQLPVSLQTLAKNLTKVSPERNIWIIPGVKIRDVNGIPDVIRGEEVQALSSKLNQNELLIITPGTHSKWILVKNGMILWFSTFMTGDVHSAIVNHTIISALDCSKKNAPNKTFKNGVKLGYSEKNHLTHILFGARTKVLFEELGKERISDYVSGILIGAEIASGLSHFNKPPTEILLIGNKNLCLHYQQAFQIYQIETSILEEMDTTKSYIKVAEYAKLIKTSS